MTDTATLKKALLMIQTLKKKLHEQKNTIFEPMAIIGMSCRLPQANNISEFWQLLTQGINVISNIPNERWELLKGTQEIAQRDDNLPYWGGYLNHIDNFDAYFFGISPREAIRMDPQQRLLLEVAFESLEDAGLSVETIRGANMGVFSSLYASQFSHLQTLDSDTDALLLSTGSAVSIAANRLSYLFDLRGPSLTLDTACSSSLIALQLACLSIQARQCETALINGININLLPSLHSVLSKATMLSPTGQCHTFDAHADGYVQGEGAGAVVIKPLAQAIRDNDRIHAVIAGSAMNQDGKTNGLTAPNGIQQERLLDAAYKAANIDPADVCYIECHGTGTFLGDPIEAEAIGNVVGKHRDKQKPCWVSSVKTNVGHLEPAAGIISLIKTALVLKHRLIPPHLNFTKANPHIPFEKYGLRIPTTAQTLPQYNNTFVAGISGFGFGGANAHLVLRALSSDEQTVTPPHKTGADELFTIAAKNTSALQQLIERWCTYLDANPNADLARICYNLHLRRSHFDKRLAIITSSVNDLHLTLKALLIEPLASKNKVYLSPEPAQKNTATQRIEVDNIALTTLAEYYVNHASINWHTVEAKRCYQHLDMPLYPWQHKAYWPDMDQQATHEKDHHHSPLRGKQLLSPLPVHQFEFRFDTKTLPEIHDTFGVLHAGYYAEMLGYAFEQLHQTSHFALENITFSSPLFVPDGKTVLVHLSIDSDASTGRLFNIYSFDGKDNWVKHATGAVSLETVSKPNIKEPIDTLYHNPPTDASNAFYKRISSMGMPTGDTIRWIEQFWLNPKQILCQLRQAKPADRPNEFILNAHPGIIDACIQSLFLLLPQKISTPYMASRMGHLAFYQKATEPCFVYSELKEQTADGQLIFGDWYLLDKQLSIIAACTNLQLTQLGDIRPNPIDESNPASFQLDWSLPYESCKHKLMGYLVEQFAHIFSMPKQDIPSSQSLNELGMDSLMALVMIKALEKNLGVNYSLALMMKGPSIEELTEALLAEKSISKPDNLSPPRQSKDLRPDDSIALKHKPLADNWAYMPTIKPTNRWIAYRQVQKNPSIRLFCFPYGGGGATIYREWQKNLPDYIEVCPIQLPGRENRIDEPPFQTMDRLISTLINQIRPLLDLPFAFFGHSFGALIAFELTRALRKQHLPHPVHLFASAYPNPQKPSSSLNQLLAHLEQKNIHLFDLNQTTIAELDDIKLTTLTGIFRDNGIIDYTDERMNKSIIQVLLPIFIGDMNIVKSYNYVDERPFNLNLTVFYGKKDTWVHPDELVGWEKHSVKPCDFIAFDSGHLFVREQNIRTTIIKAISQCLSLYQAEQFESLT